MSTQAPPDRTRRPWTGGRIVLVILGSLGVLVALALAGAGGVLLWADQTERGEDGYLSTPTERFRSDAHAITTENVDAGATGPEWAWSEDLIGTLRIRAEAADGEVFLGIARTSDVARYLSGVAHDQVSRLVFEPFSVEYRRFPGGEPPTPPGEQTFWAASASGSGERELEWVLESGEWAVVVMNGDGSAGVDVALSAAAEASFLLWLAIALLVLGVLVLLGSGVLLFLALREGRAPPPRTSDGAASG